MAVPETVLIAGIIFAVVIIGLALLWEDEE